MNKILQVLVVDDNEEGRMILSKLLTSIKYEVKEVRNGIEVLESLKASKTDLIISDILMPDMEGYTLIRELDKAIGGGKIPVVLYSVCEQSCKKGNPGGKFLWPCRSNIFDSKGRF